MAHKQGEKAQSEKPSWWKDSVHGKAGLAEAKRLRLAGQLNRKLRPVGAKCLWRQIEERKRHGKKA